MDKPLTKNDQINIYPLIEDGVTYGWAAEIMLYPGEECSYQDREWLRLGYFSDKATARKRALEAVND